MSDKKVGGPSLRDCRLSDDEAVLDLWKQAGAIPSVTDTADNLRRAVVDTCASVLVAEVEERLVGSIIGTFDGWRGNLYRLAVHPEYRRQGVARALVAEVEKKLTKQGVKRITALVNKDHPWATGFWEAVGYGRDNRIFRYVRTLPGKALPASVKENRRGPITVNEQIHLSEIQRSDQAACLEHLKEREIYDLTLRMPYPYTEADFQAWLEIVEKATMHQGQPVHWAIRDEKQFLIGACGFPGLHLGKSHQAEIGYWLAKPYWGQGVMTAVVRRLCEFAFVELGVVKIVAQVFAGNAGSAKVLEKCGFQQEGFLQKHHLKDGKYLDARLFGLIKDDF